MYYVCFCICRPSLNHRKGSDIWRCKCLSSGSFTAWHHRRIYFNTGPYIWNPSFAYRARILGICIVSIDFLHRHGIYCSVCSPAIYWSIPCRYNILLGNCFCRDCCICACPWSSFLPVLCRGCTYGCQYFYHGNWFFKIQIMQEKSKRTGIIFRIGFITLRVCRQLSFFCKFL